ncbi:phage tail terminator protein [Roseibium litorale]|uniref:Uncharacterized protein n=1 Tax=Roseibium litorale TaxID=2803841 RepID=A0ABR9CH09_9HYPH|nr:hypothetical protein [Roseibium litorale]MBD8890151.1 hypothetical protein [Roseibium litorale]
MSLVASFQARLSAAGSLFRQVAGSYEFANLDKKAKASPAAFVMVREDASGDNERLNGPVFQRVETDVAVLIRVTSLAGNAGAVTDIETLKAHARGRLLGFVPDGCDEPVTHISGALVKASGGEVWWEDVFSAPQYIEEQA